MTNLPEWVLWLVGVPLALWLVPYLVGPLVIYLQMRFKVPPTIERVRADEPWLSDEMRAFLGSAGPALQVEGFEFIETLSVTDLTPQTRSLFAVYVNRRTGDYAMAAVIANESAETPRITACYVEFLRRFTDGRTVMTNNTKELGAFVAKPTDLITRFAGLDEVARLFAIHGALARRFAQGAEPVFRLDTEFGGDLLRWVQEAVFAESFADQIATGYLARTPEGFRPTPKGALLMTWQELWPAKAIRRARSSEVAAARLRGVESELPGAA